jgi:hypothetical protein
VPITFAHPSFILSLPHDSWSNKETFLNQA